MNSRKNHFVSPYIAPFGGSDGRYTDYQQHLATIERVREKARAGASVIVLPESVLGVSTPTIERLWTSALEDLDITVYGGVLGMVSLDAGLCRT